MEIKALKASTTEQLLLLFGACCLFVAPILLGVFYGGGVVLFGDVEAAAGSCLLTGTSVEVNGILIHDKNRTFLAAIVWFALAAALLWVIFDWHAGLVGLVVNAAVAMLVPISNRYKISIRGEAVEIRTIFSTKQ